jgi:hypothetical protein
MRLVPLTRRRRAARAATGQNSVGGAVLTGAAAA